MLTLWPHSADLTAFNSIYFISSTTDADTHVMLVKMIVLYISLLLAGSAVTITTRLN